MPLHSVVTFVWVVNFPCRTLLLVLILTHVPPGYVPLVDTQKGNIRNYHDDEAKIKTKMWCAQQSCLDAQNLRRCCYLWCFGCFLGIHHRQSGKPMK